MDLQDIGCYVCGCDTYTARHRGTKVTVTVRTPGGQSTEQWCMSCLHALSDFKRERYNNEQRAGTK